MATAGQLYAKKPVPAQITFPTDDPDNPVIINVTYYPARATPKLIRQLYAADHATEQAAGVVGLVLHWIASWDLTEDDGETPVPLTRERLEEFDSDVLMSIITQLGAEQQAPNAGTASSSRAGSRGSLV